MKKALIVLLSLSLVISLAACGKNSGSKAPAKAPASAEAGGASAKPETQEPVTYGVGESVEVDGLSITVDKVETADPYIALEKAKDGLVYIKVWFTFKNISGKAIDSPRSKALCVVHREGPTGSDSEMVSEENSQVMLEVPDRDERYMLQTELAPGESTGGWMLYQRQADKNEVTMHYYPGYINVPPSAVFRFTA